MHSCSAEQSFVSASYPSQLNCFNHSGGSTREFDAELVLHFFWAGWSDETVIGFAFLRYAESKKQKLLIEIIPVERLTVIIKLIHFLMRLRPKKSIELPKQSIEICKLINLLIKQSS